MSSDVRDFDQGLLGALYSFCAESSLDRWLPAAAVDVYEPAAASSVGCSATPQLWLACVCRGLQSA